MIGIYIIVGPEFTYVGQSVHIKRRWSEHRIALAKNKHANSEIQKDYNLFGLDVFTFYVAEECSILELDTREYHWMIQIGFHKLYNGLLMQSERDMTVFANDRTRKNMQLASPTRKPIKLPDGQEFSSQQKFARACKYADKRTVSSMLRRGSSYEHIARMRGVLKDGTDAVNLQDRSKEIILKDGRKFKSRRHLAQHLRYSSDAIITNYIREGSSLDALVAKREHKLLELD